MSIRGFVVAAVLALSMAAQGQSFTLRAKPIIPEYAPVAGYDWIAFCPDEVPDHPVLRLALFRKPGPLPPGGRAPVIVPLLSNWIRTEQPDVLTRDAHPQWWWFVHAGFDVWLVSLPPCRGGSSPVAVDDVVFDLSSNPQQLGPVYKGNGTTYALDAPVVTDPEWLMPFKVFGMACQWIAVNGPAAGSRMDMATMKGRSAGFDTGAYAALGPDLAPAMWPGGTGLKAVSTRIFKAVIGEIGPTWFPIYQPTSAGTDFKATKFAINAPPWDVPAMDFSEVALSTLQNSSALLLAQLPTVYLDNLGVSVYLQYAQDGTGTEPYTVDNISGTETVGHSNWSGKAMDVAGLVDRLVAITLNAYDPVYFDAFLNTNLEGEELLYHDQIQWLKAELGYDPFP